MSGGAVAGFALVFVVAAWTASALGALVLGCRSLQRLGPWAERRTAAVVAAAPVVLGVIAVVALVVQSVTGVDHCGAHGHHAHLCLVHGAAWSERAWVLGVLACAALIAAGRGAGLASRYVRGARSIRALHVLSRELGPVRVVESERAFCFLARRRIYVSSRAWTALTESERHAVLAHEAAHLRHGDLRVRALLEVALVFAAPFAAGRVRGAWLDASERVCDARAAAEAGDPTIVASAMLAMCRLHASCPPHAFGFTPTAAEVEGRIRAVLDGGPLGERAARWIGRIALAACAMVTLAALARSAQVHHALETLLG